jgi:glycosyltransferase involved in cell wall biosynthesis
VDASVIICTYNRSANLPAVLQCLAAQQGVDDLDWEILVVDNNSTDDTRAVVERLAADLPIRVRYAFEPEQGLNHARNRGIQETAGTYFIYIDDDILVSAGWLAAMVGALRGAGADAVGGRIHLDDGVRLPAWIQPDMYGFLGFQDYGSEPFEMDGVRQYPFGGNMGYHRRVVERIGLFDTRLGRKGEGRRRSELSKGAETDFLHRLSASGGARIVYAPDAIVRHMVKPFQVEKRYFRTLHYARGYQEAFYDDRDYPRRLLGVPRFVYGQVLRHLFRYVAMRLREGADRSFRQQMNLGYFLGRMRGYARAARERT